MACHLTLSQRLSSLRDDVIFWLGKFSSDTLLKFFCAKNFKFSRQKS